MNNKNSILGFNKEKLKQLFLFWSLVGAGFFALVFFLTSTWIGVSVKEKCLIAKSRYSGNCVEALTQLVDDDSASFHERNDAIWSLGQLGDSRAKTVLEKYYTGNIPKKESYNQVLSQYEMKKALKLVDGGFNMTHFVWYDDKLLN